MLSTGKKRTADICLIFEGTYPYGRGGVSTWAHQIISSMPDLRFAVFHIGAKKDDAAQPVGDLPPNVTELIETYLFDESFRPEIRGKKVHPALEFGFLYESLAAVMAGPARKEAIHELLAVVAAIAPRCEFEAFWDHHLTFSFLTDFYRERFPRESFIDCFRSLELLLRPVWTLFQSCASLPLAACYHSVSAGYGGLVGAHASRQEKGTSFLLSEHGIYVKERLADLLRSGWEEPAAIPGPSLPTGIHPLRQLWIDFFIQVAQFAYESADEIVSLSRKQADQQAEFGADPEKMRIIPNGIDLPRFEAVRRERIERIRLDGGRKQVGFLGRVVPAKDIKTLLQAARLVSDRIADARFLVVGPTGEEPDYFEDCRRLAKDLELDNVVLFTGPGEADDMLPELDVLALSSSDSEGMPFAVLEAFGAQIPVVATDVGACSELIRGGEGDDLGSAGRIVPAGDPVRLADAIAELLTDPGLRQRYGSAGRARVGARYSRDFVVEEYRELYHRLSLRVITGDAATPTPSDRQPEPV